MSSSSSFAIVTGAVASMCARDVLAPVEGGAPNDLPGTSGGRRRPRRRRSSRRSGTPPIAPPRESVLAREGLEDRPSRARRSAPAPRGRARGRARRVTRRARLQPASPSAAWLARPGVFTSASVSARLAGRREHGTWRTSSLHATGTNSAPPRSRRRRCAAAESTPSSSSASVRAVAATDAGPDGRSSSIWTWLPRLSAAMPAPGAGSGLRMRHTTASAWNAAPACSAGRSSSVSESGPASAAQRGGAPRVDARCARGVRRGSAGRGRRRGGRRIDGPRRPVGREVSGEGDHAALDVRLIRCALEVLN